MRSLIVLAVAAAAAFGSAVPVPAHSGQAAAARDAAVPFKVGERLTVFMGPGLEFWSGKQKLTVGGAGSESESVKRYGVSGRIGGFMALTDRVAIMGQVGHTFGLATVTDGAKSTWLPSSFNASWGLTFGL